jgi:hypothetical protein
MNSQFFVLQKLVKTQQTRGREKFVTWRTVSKPMAEKDVVAKLHQLPWTQRFRALNSPAQDEMALGGKCIEWTL